VRAVLPQVDGDLRVLRPAAHGHLAVDRAERLRGLGEDGLGPLRRRVLAVDPALPEAALGVLHHEPDEHLDARVLAGQADRLRDVGGLLRLGDALRLARLRLVAVLRDPDRDVLALERGIEVLLEPGEAHERHVRIADELGRLLVDRERVGVLCPGVELDALHVRRDTLHERRGCDGVGAGALLVTPVRGRLADPDLRAAVPGLDTGDPRLRELGVVRRADDLALRVELRYEERREVRLVPDREEADVRIAGVTAGVAGRDRAGEILEVGEARGHRLRLLAAVRPRGRAPQG